MTKCIVPGRWLRRRLIGATLSLTLLSLSAQAQGPTLNETGSTLLYPLFQRWIPDYMRLVPGVTITAAATGSGTGIAAAISGDADIGASDAYMSDEQAGQNTGIVNIPLAISAQTVNYNIPGLNDAGLKLDGPTLAGIYDGRIKDWDAAPIAELNPHVELPHQLIVPIRRSDASGDTFIFTQFLDFSTQSWENRIGYGTSIAWPGVAGEKTVSGNEAMVQALAATPYSVGYVGVSYRDAIAKAGLGTAPLGNQGGRFVLPSADTISAAASVLDPRTPADERLSLVFAPGDDSYPLVNYEYAVVSVRQANPESAAALRRFLLWAVSIEGGNAQQYLGPVGFIPLPDFIRALSENQINRLK
ncbi:MAG: phosphate ABC transporter substrate-binding protein PstS [Acetobacteraceae bacterium]|jgi:phosphate transport system substrate-binding protein